MDKQIICPCGHPIENHIPYSGCFTVVNTPENGDICQCTISADSLNELGDQLSSLQDAKELANAVKDVFSCWLDEDRQDDLDGLMAVMYQKLINFERGQS